MNHVINTLLIALVIQSFFFFGAFKFKTDKLTDLAYGMTFIVIATYLLINSPKYNYQVVTFLMILFWGIRLSVFLFVRVLLLKKDGRFDGIRDNIRKFAQFWFFQGMSVWVIMIPATILLTQKDYSAFGLAGLFGFIIWLFGLTTETVADIQKFIFKNKYKTKWVNVGLWKYARHPNYFGEILVWWGIWILAMPHYMGIELLSILGPIYITILLLKISGVPILEKKYKKEYRENGEYKKYYDSTNLLVPIPKRFFSDSNAKF
jgi:steroid 5-alpha reductase family enzyme